jgi:hypothetical protein
LVVLGMVRLILVVVVVVVVVVALEEGGEVAVGVGDAAAAFHK